MAFNTWRKQPADVEPVPVSYVDYLAEAGGDTIATASAVITDPPDASLVVDSTAHLGGIVNVWLSGGTHLSDYHVTVTVTTTAGRTKEFDFKVKVREKVR